jgi:hypothetical protein
MYKNIIHDIFRTCKKEQYLLQLFYTLRIPASFAKVTPGIVFCYIQEVTPSTTSASDYLVWTRSKIVLWVEKN